MPAVQPEVGVIIGFMSEGAAAIGCIVRIEDMLEVDSQWHPMQIVLNSLYAAPGQLLRSVWPISMMYIDPCISLLTIQRIWPNRHPTQSRFAGVSRIYGMYLHR